MIVKELPIMLLTFHSSLFVLGKTYRSLQSFVYLQCMKWKISALSSRLLSHFCWSSVSVTFKLAVVTFFTFCVCNDTAMGVKPHGAPPWHQAQQSNDHCPTHLIQTLLDVTFGILQPSVFSGIVNDIACRAGIFRILCYINHINSQHVKAVSVNRQWIWLCGEVALVVYLMAHSTSVCCFRETTSWECFREY